MDRISADEVLRKYREKIKKQIGEFQGGGEELKSQDYIKFRQEMGVSLTGYEKWAFSLGSFIKLKIAKKDEEEIQKYIKIAHLEIEPWQAVGLAVFSFMGLFLLGLGLSIGVVLINGSFSSFPFLFFLLVLVSSIFVFYFLRDYPKRIANSWRLKASSQMVPAILYTVVYMRHTPNLEKAIAFAAQNLSNPLSLDFRKIFYDVEIGAFSRIQDSLNNYLDGWKDYSTEFVEAFHLIESSLFEADNGRRIVILEKALSVVLDGVYDKMMRFTHDVKSPLTNVYMLGVVLPTLGLALLPLASALLGGILQTIHVLLIFNVIVPFLVFYLTDQILFLRPGGHGEGGAIEKNPYYGEYLNKRGYFKGFLIAFPFLVLGLLPFLFGYTGFAGLIGMERDFTYSQIGLGFFGDSKVFGFEETLTGIKGPFGVGALILSFFVPFGVMFFFAVAFRERTFNLIKEREKTKELEDEFNNSLFALGNRIGNGTPPELVFGVVANSLKGLRTEEFFRRVDYNIKRLGMDVKRAIFEEKSGALRFYPSDLIATSMGVLVEAVKKGLNIAAVSLMSISSYIKNIKRINLRLRDILAEVSSDMKSNMTFLAPLLSGIVVGLSAMITYILGKLNFEGIGEIGASGVGGLATFVEIFNINSMVSPYFLQISIGIYLIEIIFILTGALVVIDSGQDQLLKTHRIGENLRKGIVLYLIIGLLSVICLFFLASTVLSGIF